MVPILPDSVAAVFIASFPAGPWQTNCYLVATQPGEECLVVDPGMGALDGVADLVREHRLKPVAAVLTHGHLDHMFSVTPLCRSYASTCWIHSDDRVLLSDPLRAMSADTRRMLAQLSGGTTSFTEPDTVAELVDGTQFEAAGLTLGAIHAPGHTPGSVMFRTAYPDADEVDSLVFSGDVLFAGSIGRTDLPGGSHPDMLNSLRTKVLPLPDQVVVLPGHGSQTTIGREKAVNPYLQELM
jgi:glyoxylase-like metal-dependent hydrolase (beta-lactamase superfamily II)